MMTRLILNRVFNSLSNYISRSYGSSVTLQTEKYLQSNQVNGVRIITLSHAATRNALSLEMMKALYWNITRDVDNEDLRSIVITAAPGKVFSAGHNLKELSSAKGAGYHQEIFQSAAELMTTLTKLPVPVIAAVDGLAAAAGCQLVSACDIAICTERSSFSTPGANFGIFCSTPGIPLARSVPRKIAANMLFSGLPITSQEAYNAGLISKVVPNDKLDEEMKKLVDAINSKSRSVVRIGKQFFYEQLELDQSTAYAYGTEIMVANLELEDAQEGIRSFVEKRKPKWSHKFGKDNK